MSDDDEPLPSFLYFPGEIELEAEAFEKSPVAAIFKFLECFDEEGRQRHTIPPHTLRILVACLHEFVNGIVPDLNNAFGGQVARQRKNLLQQQKDMEVLWTLYDEWERAKQASATEVGTPFERAVEQTANALQMSADNVRRIYKKYGRKGR